MPVSTLICRTSFVVKFFSAAVPEASRSAFDASQDSYRGVMAAKSIALS